MATEGLCWCASDSKCPHGISSKLPVLWEDMEKIIDDVLIQFDRKLIKRFLKGDPTAAHARVADQMKSSVYNNTVASSSDQRTGTSIPSTKRSRTADSNHDGVQGGSRTEAALFSSPYKGSNSNNNYNNNNSNNNNMKTRPTTTGGSGSTPPEVEVSLLESNSSYSKVKISSKVGSEFKRDLMSASLPQLPTTNNNSNNNNSSSNNNNNSNNYNISGSMKSKHNLSNSTQAWVDKNTNNNTNSNTNSAKLINNSQPIEILGETTISVGLMRIADKLARLMLPWQAVLCPRAVETLFDLRQSMIQSRHETFMIQMRQKLEDKVLSFITKKEEEVELWLETEVKTWKAYMSKDEADLIDYIKEDLNRISDRSFKQDIAYRQRELTIATIMDDHERDSTREQLINFRRVCKAQAPKNNSSDHKQQRKALEVKLLQDSISKAQSVVHKKMVTTQREVIRKLEESHDWLCSLADNAITASQCEGVLKSLYAGLDTEKQRGIKSLYLALSTYKEQHGAILEAITIFTGRIHQHASDYLQREQLVARAFQQYLLGVVSGEIKVHTLETKKNSYAWETKSIADRSHKKEQSLIADFHANLDPLNKLADSFKERMRIQLDLITMKLQSVLNGRENDINARKSRIHKKLAKHVNKACNDRRQRLKDCTTVRRDEFQLEGTCIANVDELSQNLRVAIDQLWVREHLKERRIYEAANGRMERLEKSALVIWNKHSHLAIDQKEDYEDWLNIQRKDRELRINERRQHILREWKHWREKFGVDIKNIAIKLCNPVKKLLAGSLIYDADVPVETNLNDLRYHVDTVLQEVTESIDWLRNKLSSYLRNELTLSDSFATTRKSALLKDWQENLYLLNSAINRRVGGLKDMEADLEETIRMTVLQHEVENSVFEQLSCSRFEHFWLGWRARMFHISKKIREEQEDYKISKYSGKVKSRSSRKDRALDDLMEMAHATDLGNNNNNSNNYSMNKTSSNTIQPGNLNYMDLKGIEEKNPKYDLEPEPSENEIPTDTERLKRILDDIKPDIYREFTHKITRLLEKIRRDLGEGRKRISPPFAIAKCLITCCDVFWDRAKLSERCVGRISSKGVLLFSDGLPVNARALFGIASTMYIISQMQLKESMRGIDCNDIFEMMNDIKQVFLIGLLTISIQYGTFGDYLLKSECIWACSCFGIDPPAELIMKLDAKGLDKSFLESTQPTGFYSDDPIDLTNCILTLTTELAEIKQLQEEYHNLQLLQANVPLSAVLEQHSTIDDENSLEESDTPYHKQQQNKSPSHQIDALSSSFVFSVTEEYTNASHTIETTSLTEDNIVMPEYRNEPKKVAEKLQSHVPYLQQLSKLEHLIPAADISVLAALLGRPNDSIELTPHRVCQVISLWRRTALAVITAAFDPPSNEYPRAKDLITAHHAMITGTKRNEFGNVNCISPFEGVSNTVDWVTSIKGLPLSLNQALCVISRGGSCDPWLEDPKQTGRSNRILYEIHEFLDVMGTDTPKVMNHEEFLQATWPAEIQQALNKLDLNYAGVLPLEALRTYIQREDLDLSNTQISMIYWTLCREDGNNPVDLTSSSTIKERVDSNSIQDNLSFNPSFQTGGVYRPIIETTFLGNPEEYLAKFAFDVDKYLNSMPTIDSNVILGYLPGALVPASAFELVSDAMKLDISAKNMIPNTCCVWLGQRSVNVNEALNALSLDHPRSKEGNYLLTIGPKAFHSKNCKSESAKFRYNARTYVEIDLLSKYPEICDIISSNRHYGPAGSVPILVQQGFKKEDHWHELMNRRLNRMDKLTIAWRNTMMNEWSTSIYQSRQERYLKRVDIVKRCVGMYHQQYAHLRDSIVAERSNLIARYSGIEAELLSLIQDDYNFFSFQTSYLERALRRYEGQLERIIVVVGDIMEEFQRHCGTIKRRGIARIAAASDTLQKDLEQSCNGLILGYTAGFAQGYFDELIYRGEVWRKTLTNIQGILILEKEKYVNAKDDIDRDLTIQITDRLTLDRNKFKGHLESLADDTAHMLDKVSSTRASYASIQKDANARLILRIEKAVRESRKLRVAAEQQADLEGPVMRDIRVVLDTARTSCISIVAQIKDTCLKQIYTIEPLRPSHRDKMESKLHLLKTNWIEQEKVFAPLLSDYKREVFKHLSSTKAQCMEMIGNYRDKESKDLKDTYKTERSALIDAFRKHFREYDLSEAVIFERFNREVLDTVNEMNISWGPSRPQFISAGLQELDKIVIESLQTGTSDVNATRFIINDTINDYDTMIRMEITDIFTYSLNKCTENAKKIPLNYIIEKKNQLVYVEEMSMERNGDMVRPQVKAVMDLLLSGIEIDSDFASGYDSLSIATLAKCSECSIELNDFFEKNMNPNNPSSIDYSVSLTLARIDQRRQEVNSMIEASEAHLISDHSRLDILLSAGQKDIEEWASLTLQLIENAFHNAENSYLSNLWPAPPATPRLELVPEEEDRVGKLKALLKATNEANISRAAIDGIEGGSRGITSNQEMALAILGGELEDDEEIVERLKRSKKEIRKSEKAKAKEEKQKQLREAELRLNALSLPNGVKQEETRELQQGWFQCITTEGYTYYYHPETEESLWQLPLSLIKPLIPDDLDEEDSLLEMETPRGLIMDDPRNTKPKETIPIRVVPATYHIKMVLDPAVLMTQVAEEARATSVLVIDTALDITSVIRGKRGKDEKTIATVLGDKFNPDFLKKKHLTLDNDDTYDQNSVYFNSRGIVAIPSNSGKPAEDTRTVDSGIEFNSKGHLISVNNEHDSKVNDEMIAMLLDLGLGSETDTMIEKETTTILPNRSEDWLALSLGGGDINKFDNEGDSSDGENYTGYKEEALKRRAEQRYLESRESDLMTAEDELSILYENYLENDNCQAFMTLFQSIISSNTATTADKEHLLMISNIVKPINVMDILSAINGSWKLLDNIVTETTAREIARKEMEERLRTEEGLVRQQIILEHFEDVEDMADFLHTAGLSKTTAKRVATECILRNISTPKKLAKIWNREHISLKEFNIDDDDIEEIERALKLMLVNSTTSGNELKVLNNIFVQQQQQQQLALDYQPHHSIGSHHSNAIYSPASAAVLQQPPPENSKLSLVKSKPASVASIQSLPNHPYNIPDNNNNNNSLLEIGYNSTTSYVENKDSMLDLGVAMVSHDSNIDEDDATSEVASKLDIHNQSKPKLLRKQSSKRFFVTKTGYKSFVGGWVEGISDDGNVYYYNTITGESSWQLPGVKEDDHEELIEDLRDNASLGTGTNLNYQLPPDMHNPNGYIDPQIQQQEEQYYQQDNNYGSYDNYGYAAVPYDPNYQFPPQEEEYQSYDQYNTYEDENQYNYEDPNNNQFYDNNQYYDDNNYNQPYSTTDYYNAATDYNGDGTWNIHDALGLAGSDDDSSINNNNSNSSTRRRKRHLPIPMKSEVQSYSQNVGIARQLSLLSSQDRWQNALVKSQHYITEQKSQYLQARIDMFEKVSIRIETRLAAFVDDIKYMQKTLKKELGDSVSTERDIRRLFEQSVDDIVRAEKLSFILESLEKFKLVASERYESAFVQIDKFGSEWELIRAELMQVGDIYDEGVASNLEQCKIACEHNAKVFIYDQLKIISKIKHVELRAIRNAIHRNLRSDTFEEQDRRKQLCNEHDQYNKQRDIKRAELHRLLGGWDKTIEAELKDAGYPIIEEEFEAVPEEEYVMSYMLTQIEMEISLSNDYDSITMATKSMAEELQNGIKDFDDIEKMALAQDGSWYNKHRETLERHEQALHATLTKVRDRMNEGYQLLHAKLEELDYEVERAAEEELFKQDQEDD